MPSTTLEQLNDIHHDTAADIVRKQLEQINFRINPNDIGWLYMDEVVDKNAGRSKNVFNRLVGMKYKN